MKTPSLLLAVSAFALSLLNTSCTTMREQRIAENAAYFSSLPPKDQEIIKKGGVRIGMSKESVKLSLGNPNQTGEIVSKSGKTEEFWTYLSYQPVQTPAMIMPTYPSAYPYRHMAYYDMAPVISYIPFEHFRIRFGNGLVSGWEQHQPPQ